MMTAISNLLLLVLGITVMVLWIIALAGSDGKCHCDDCGRCPYAGDCPWEEERKHEEDT